MSKVLLVDDDKFVSKLLQEQLVKRGIDCLLFDTKHKINDFIAEENIELVLLDIIMPVKTGDIYLKEIRSNYSSLELPVIMTTSQGDEKNIVDFLKMGANDYLVKPININICIERINTQIKLKDLLVQAKKAEEARTYGKMITTLSHEIRNPLTIAIMNLQLAKQNKDNFKKVEEALSRVKSIMEKMNQIAEDKKFVYMDPIKNNFDLD